MDVSPLDVSLLDVSLLDVSRSWIYTVFMRLKNLENHLSENYRKTDYYKLKSNLKMIY